MTNRRAKSTKVADPAMLFDGWSFRIDRCHWPTLGVSLRTFYLNNEPYLAWAMDSPPIYGFRDGYAFRPRDSDNATFLQIAAYNAPDDIEVHTGTVSVDHSRRGFRTTEAGLVEWLRLGCPPAGAERLSRGQGKAGLLSWLLPNIEGQ